MGPSLTPARGRARTNLRTGCPEGSRRCSRAAGYRAAVVRAPQPLEDQLDDLPGAGMPPIEEPTPASGSYSGQVTLEEALRRRVGTTWQMLLKELSAFGVVGAIAFAMELGLFQLFYAHAGLGAVTAKLLATVLAMTVAYLGHRYWSFSHRERTGVSREYLLFSAINGSTLLLGLAIVAFVRYSLGQESALVLQMANVVSIAVGTVIRFLSYRRWVFPSAQHLREVPGSA
jgi:putative flippase GtrA